MYGQDLVFVDQVHYAAMSHQIPAVAGNIKDGPADFDLIGIGSVAMRSTPCVEGDHIAEFEFAAVGVCAADNVRQLVERDIVEIVVIHSNKSRPFILKK